MFALAVHLVVEASWSNINFNLADGGLTQTGWAAVPVILSSIALVVSYFSGPMLNYGEHAGVLLTQPGEPLGRASRYSWLHDRRRRPPPPTPPPRGGRKPSGTRSPERSLVVIGRQH